jgi:hypothetical protein
MQFWALVQVVVTSWTVMVDPHRKASEGNVHLIMGGKVVGTQQFPLVAYATVGLSRNVPLHYCLMRGMH